jgi:NADPH:quinone reductase-like Zn-dependent oxidoreductase
MRAIRVKQYGGPEVLILENDVPKPVIGDDEVGNN